MGDFDLVCTEHDDEAALVPDPAVSSAEQEVSGDRTPATPRWLDGSPAPDPAATPPPGPSASLGGPVPGPFSDPVAGPEWHPPMLAAPDPSAPPLGSPAWMDPVQAGDPPSPTTAAADRVPAVPTMSEVPPGDGSVLIDQDPGPAAPQLELIGRLEVPPPPRSGGWGFPSIETVNGEAAVCIEGVETPQLPEDPLSSTEETIDRRTTEHAETAICLPEEAEAHIPENPQREEALSRLDDEGDPASTTLDDVPAATAALAAAAGRAVETFPGPDETTARQTLASLATTRSPRSELPIVIGSQALSVAEMNALLTLPARPPTVDEDATGEDRSRQERVRFQTEALISARDELLQESGLSAGLAEGNPTPDQVAAGRDRESLQDIGELAGLQPRTPPPPPVTDPGTVEAVLAELVASADTRAERIMRRCRVAAFPHGLLEELAPQTGNGSFREQLENDLLGHLGDMAEAAGITAQQLALSADDRARELAAEAWLAEAELATGGDRLDHSLEQAGEQLDAAADDGQTRVESYYQRLSRVAAFDTDQDPWLTVRDTLNADIETRCAEMKLQYRRMQEERPGQLDAQRDELVGSIDRVKQLEEIDWARDNRRQASAQAARFAMRDDPQMAAVVTWHADLTTAVHRAFRGRAEKDRRSIDGFIRDVDTKRKEARWAVLDFVDPHLGLWDSITTMIDEWVNDERDQAEAEAALWHRQQNQANAAAISGDQQVLQATIGLLEDQVVDEATLAGMQLTEEQRAILHAYYIDGESMAAAVARGTEERLFQQMRPEVVRGLEAEIVAEGDWRILEQLAHSRNDRFDVEGLVDDLENAFEGGLLEGGTIEADVFTALDRLAPIEIAALRKCWADKHDGQTLDAAIASELDDDIIFDDDDDPELERARELLSGNQAAADARAIHYALRDGWFSGDADAVDRMFAGKPLTEREAIVREYEQIYDVDLVEELAEHLDDDILFDDDEDTEAGQAIAFAQGEDVRARAIGAYGALSGWNDEQALWNELDAVRTDAEGLADQEGWSHAQLQAEIRYRMGEFGTEFGSYGNSWEDFDDAIEDQLGEDEQDIATGYTENDMARVDAGFLELQYEMVFDDDNEIVQRMRNAEVRAMAEVRRDLGPAIRQSIVQQIRSGRLSPELRRAGFVAALPGPPHSWPELQREALERLVAAEIRRQAAPITQENHQAMELAFETHYRDNWWEGLSGLAAYHTSGYHQQQIFSLSNHDGAVPLHVQIHDAASGYATDIDTLKQVFGSLTAEEIAQLEQDWAAEYGSSPSMREVVERAIEGEGQDEAEVSHLLHGQATTVYESQQRERERVLWELENTGSGWSFWGLTGPTDTERAAWLDGAEPEAGQWLAGIGGEDREAGRLIEEWRQFDTGVTQFDEDARTALEAHWERSVAHLADPEQRRVLLQQQRDEFALLPADEQQAQLYWHQLQHGGSSAQAALNDLGIGLDAVPNAVEQLRLESSEFERDAGRIWSVTVAVAGIVIGIILAPETGGGSLVATIAGVSALVGAAGGMAIKSMARGEGYGSNEVTIDIAVGSVDAVLAAGTAGLGGRLRGPLMAAGDDLVRLRAGLSQYGAVVRNIPPNRLLSQMAASGSRSQRVIAFVGSEVVEQTAANAPGAILGSAMDERTYRSGNAFTTVMSATGEKVGTATILSVGIGGGLNLLQTGGRLPDVPLASDPPGAPPVAPRTTAEFEQQFRTWRGNQAEGEQLTELDFMRHLARQMDDPHLPRSEAEWAVQQRAFEQHPELRGAEDFSSDMREAFLRAGERAHDLHAQRSGLVEGLRSEATPDQQAVLQDLPADVVDETAFARIGGQGTDDLRVVVRDGQVVVVQRAGSSPSAADFASIRTILEAQVVPGSGGRPRNLEDLVPRDLRRQVRVRELAAEESQAGARIQPLTDADGSSYLGFVLQVGADADMTTIRAHFATIRALRQYSGMRRRLRMWFRRFRGLETEDLRSAAQEVPFELRKLEGLIAARQRQILEGGVSPDRVPELEAGIRQLQREVEGHMLRLELEQQLAELPAAGSPPQATAGTEAAEQISALRRLADRLESSGDADAIAEAARLRQMAVGRELEAGDLSAVRRRALEQERIDEEWTLIAHELDAGVRIELDLQEQLARAFGQRRVDDLRSLADRVEASGGPDAAVAAARMRQLAARHELEFGHPPPAVRAQLETELIDLEWTIIGSEIDGGPSFDADLRQQLDQAVADHHVGDLRRLAERLDGSGSQEARELAARMRLLAARHELDAHPAPADAQRLGREILEQEQLLAAAGSSHPDLDVAGQAARAASLERAQGLLDLSSRIREVGGPRSEALGAIAEREGLRLMLDQGAVASGRQQVFHERIGELDRLIADQLPNSDGLSPTALGYIASGGDVTGLPRGPMADDLGNGARLQVDRAADGSSLTTIRSGDSLDSLAQHQDAIDATFAHESGRIMHHSMVRWAERLEQSLGHNRRVELRVTLERGPDGSVTAAHYDLFATRRGGRGRDGVLSLSAHADADGRLVAAEDGLQFNDDFADHLARSSDPEIARDLESLRQPTGAFEPLSVSRDPSAVDPAEASSGIPLTRASGAAVDPALPARQARGATAQDYLEALRSSRDQHGRASHGGPWDWDAHPTLPEGAAWQPGDPIDMPNGNGEYPDYNSTTRERYWRNRAYYELQARSRGAEPDPSDPIRRMSQEELESTLVSGRSPLDPSGDRQGQVHELEHNAAPQRAVRAFTDAGFDPAVARELAHVSHPDTFFPLTRSQHTEFDAEAYNLDHHAFRRSHAQQSYDQRPNRSIFDPRRDPAAAGQTDIFANLPPAFVRRMITIFNQQSGRFDMDATPRSIAAKESFLRRCQELGIRFTFP